MNNEITVTKIIPATIQEIFPYFIESKKIEQWSAPEGMTLKVPVFEAKEGGKYRYEHTGAKGVYVCEGHIEKLIPNQKIKMVDEFIKDPEGKEMKNLVGEVTFMKTGNGTKVTVNQSGFTEVADAKDCEMGWTSCLNQLANIVGGQEMKRAG
ncbi:MAG: SRPBCC domain-containing protein [Bdellovibrionota bacterium]